MESKAVMTGEMNFLVFTFSAFLERISAGNIMLSIILTCFPKERV